ncbi:MAG: hypothetical protein HY243_01075 [Proteobacteria bacterium]|nr:hypothetical protein [Pseudomonadota bacterium]
MNEPQDDNVDTQVSERLHNVLTMIMCPIAGCWSLHGAETAVYFDESTESFVLEAWPVTVEQPEDHAGNGHADDRDYMYEFASFDFIELVKQVPLKEFHFSQQNAVFEIGWSELGHDLELRVHLEPAVEREEG